MFWDCLLPRFISDFGNLIYRAKDEYAFIYSLGNDGFDDGYVVALSEDEKQKTEPRISIFGEVRRLRE